ncbi:MAG: FAD:protein FMN transferase [Myxococcales bacterium]|nr:FAD:protein FMN transferase [Myxococcales bacterium]
MSGRFIAALLPLLLLPAGGCSGAAAPSRARPRAGVATAQDLFAGTTRRAQWVMGTLLVIAIEAPRGLDAEALLGEAFDIVHGLDRLLSAYRRDSALSQLNRRAGRGAVQVPVELFRFLQRSQRLSEHTDGAFDIVLGALSTAHGSDRGALGAEARKRARACSGRAQLALALPARAHLRSSCARLDSGAVGKGYAVDAVVARLRARGVRRAFVNFGGSTFYGRGHPRGARAWPVLLGGADPRHAVGVVHLRDQALSTSLALPQRDEGGFGAPHIVDGRSGQLVRTQRFAAVVAPSATDADALSTALIVDPSLRPRLERRLGVRCVTR